VARVDAIVAQRDRRMMEIASLRRGSSSPASFIDKAQALLTSGWSKATWRSRAGILRAVDWLLQMERAQQKGLGNRT
jgi:hypothetical protein